MYVLTDTFISGCGVVWTLTPFDAAATEYAASTSRAIANTNAFTWRLYIKRDKAV